MQRQTRLQISRVKNVGNVFELSDVAFRLAPPYGGLLILQYCVLAILVLLPSTEILIKLLEYQSEWNRITKTEQALLNMGLRDAFHMCFYFGQLLSAAHNNDFVIKKITDRR